MLRSSDEVESPAVVKPLRKKAYNTRETQRLSDQPNVQVLYKGPAPFTLSYVVPPGDGSCLL